MSLANFCLLLNFVWIDIHILQFHVFQVQNKTIKRLCNERVIVAVNGQFPGPEINVREGDTVIVHVINESPYNITIHW